ncbi:MAG: hypothetical protein HYU37_03415 [Acidobacteria bacterium]|nr:hypothetical protein [Acidobacteriota bacterium]
MMLQAWNVILRALDTEPRSVHQIRGASGFPHHVLALGVDERRRRLIIISPEADPRVAAIIQADIQALDSSIHVLTARPILLDMGDFGRVIAESARTKEVSREQMWEAMYSQRDNLGKRFELLHHFVGNGPDQLPAGYMVEAMAQQTLLLDPPKQSPAVAERADSSTITELANSRMDISVFDGLDVLRGDRQAGICPLPLAQMSDQELETVISGTDVDAAESVLHQHDVRIVTAYRPNADEWESDLKSRKGRK